MGFHGEYTIDSQLCKFLITLNTNKKNVGRKRERKRDRERQRVTFFTREFSSILRKMYHLLYLMN